MHMSVRSVSGEYPIDLDRFCNLLIEASHIFRRHFSVHGSPTVLKGDGTPVGKADREINQLFIQRIEEWGLPVSVFGEEETRRASGATHWISVDPVDGTTAFSAGRTDCIIQAALLEDDRPVMAALYDPHRSLLFSALRNHGAYVSCDLPGMSGRRPVSVLNESQLQAIPEPAIGVSDWPSCSRDIPHACRALKKAGHKWLQFGSIGYMMAEVARGKLGGTLFPGPEIHDTVPGHLLIEEAGGIVTGLEGEKLRYHPGQTITGHIAACNEQVHGCIMRSLHG